MILDAAFSLFFDQSCWESLKNTIKQKYTAMKFIPTIIALLFCSIAFSQQNYWRATVTTGEFGALTVNFVTVEKQDYLFGTTIPNAHKRIVGGVKAAFAKEMFEKDGSVMELDSIAFRNGLLTGFLILQSKKYYLEGEKKGNVITATIKGKTSGIIYGHFEATATTILEKPKNYPIVWNELKALTEKNIYSKNALESKGWKDFVKYMDDFSTVAQDDGEFMYGFYYKGKDLGFSHYSLSGTKKPESSFAIAGVPNLKSTLRPSLKEINATTVLLDVPAFNFRANEIDSMMLQIVNSKAKNLIIDLRANSGGDMEGGMRICQYITDQILHGGVVLSQSYWNKNTQPPKVIDYTNFKVMSNENYEWYKKEVKNNIDGLCIVTTPLEKTFKGKIYILTSGNTASSSEPFVYTLQKKNIATVIGGKTAGSVLSMEHFTVQNFALTIPMLDYYTFDGNRLDQIGVAPNIASDPKDALDVALREIAKQ